MAELAWPSDLGSATIEGRVLYMEGDSSDPDRDPDVRPASGTITVEASVKDLRYVGVDGSALFVKRLTRGVINDEGYVCTPGEGDTAGEPGLIVPATDSEALTPTGFTYSVRITVGSYVTSFSIEAPSGAVVDLARAVPLPPNGGTAVVVDPTTATRAEAAATRAETAADEAEGYAPTFVWDGTKLVIDGGAPVDLKGEKGDGSAWADLTGKPATYPPAAHTHPIADVDGLQTIIDRLAYDSGVRAIHEELVNGWTATSGVYIQRSGRTVTLTITSSPDSLNGSNATAGDFWMMPYGFRPTLGNYGHIGWVSTSGTRAPVSVIKSVNYLSTTHRGLVQGILMWTTNDPIPTTLPGKP